MGHYLLGKRTSCDDVMKPYEKHLIMLNLIF